MNILQMMNWFAFTAFLGAVLVGFREMGKSVLETDLIYYLYAGFIIAFRFKLALDDHFYFGVSKLRRWQSRIGFVVGAASWFLFIFGAYSISNLAESFLLLLFAIGISTVWIVVVSINEGFYKEQVYWLGTNAAYMIGTGFLIWETKTTSYPDIVFVDRMVRFEYTPAIVIILMSVLLLWDFSKSKSMDHVRG